MLLTLLLLTTQSVINVNNFAIYFNIQCHKRNKQTKIKKMKNITKEKEWKKDKGERRKKKTEKKKTLTKR